MCSFFGSQSRHETPVSRLVAPREAGVLRIWETKYLQSDRKISHLFLKLHSIVTAVPRMLGMNNIPRAVQAIEETHALRRDSSTQEESNSGKSRSTGPSILIQMARP